MSTLIYQSRDEARKVMLAPNIKLPKAVKADDQKGYVYFLRIVGAEGQPTIIHKAGITVNVARRMAQLAKAYSAQSIAVLWISPLYAESTARRLEWHLKQIAEALGSEMIPKDRFILPPQVDELSFRVRKEYTIKVK